MPSYVPPKKATELVTYIGLVSQADTKTFKANPTIAVGDFKVVTDDGSLANLTTLPTVSPAGSKRVKITLSAAEQNGDNITVIASDAAGAEWCDAIIHIQTSAKQIDDLPSNTQMEARTIAAADYATVGSAMALANNAITTLSIEDGAITSDKFTVAAITGVATGILEKLDQIWRRFFKKVNKTPIEIKTYADNNTTVLTTQTISDDGVGNEEQGDAT